LCSLYNNTFSLVKEHFETLSRISLCT
jgi:hypothetical protein